MSKSFLILFGSVTGKAESIAELLHRDAESKGFQTRLHCMADQDQVSQGQTKLNTHCFATELRYLCEFKSFAKAGRWTRDIFVFFSLALPQSLWSADC